MGCDLASIPPRCYRCHKHDGSLLSVLLHSRGWPAGAGAAWQRAADRAGVVGHADGGEFGGLSLKGRGRVIACGSETDLEYY